MINHPLIDTLRDKLKIPYNFYIDGESDLTKLIEARGYTNDPDSAPWDDYLAWVKYGQNGMVKAKLTISKSIFEEGKLKFYSRNNWRDDFVQQIFNSVTIENKDDLPF